MTLDGARLVSNPFQAEVHSDKRAHVLHASAPGYLPVEQVITYSNDSHLEHRLSRCPARRASGTRRRGDAAQRAAIDNWNLEAARSRAPRRPPRRRRAPARTRGRSETPLPATPPRAIDEKNPYAQ